MNYTSIVCLTVLGFAMAGCGGSLEPRRPVEARGGSFMKASIQRNKILLTQEETIIKKIIAKDSLHSYRNSANGFWYTIRVKNTQAEYPKEKDIVVFDYEIKDLNDRLIYPVEEIGKNKYQIKNINKEVYFFGLRASLLLLRKGEEGVFYYPSALAYGYHGDNNKIGPNIPLKVTIRIYDIINPQI